MIHTFLLAFAVILNTAIANFCSTGSVEIDGNWYCQPVKAIQYSNVGTPGSYNQVINMASDGTCTSVPRYFSGPIAPLDEEVSMHFRGPIQLKHFAAYVPLSVTASKRGVDAGHIHRLGRQQQNVNRLAEINEIVHANQKRQEVTATIDGKVVSWQNNWPGGGANTLSAPVSASCTSLCEMVTATIDGQVVSWVNNWFGDAPPPTATSTAEEQVEAHSAGVASAMPALDESGVGSQLGTSSTIDVSSVYERIGYYDSALQTLDNLTFLGHYGGQGSGIFDYIFGASLSYINCDGTGGASSPQILADMTIPSDSEVIIMTGQECVDGDCGYVRPGAVAYHGFGGADKVFLIEFAMPKDGQTGFNGDMPAVWALNANIPRTLQYGSSNCSCWESGCGEFDIVEGLNSGSTLLKSSLHTNTPAGNADYIARPTSGTMKLAVVFSSSTSTLHIQVLPDATNFSSSITAAEIAEMCASSPRNPLSLVTIP